MRAAIYARSGQSIQHAEAQVRLGRDVVHQRGWSLHERHVFRDVASGTGVEQCPGLLSMLDSAANREVDVLVVYDRSRLSRNESWVRLIRLERVLTGGPFHYVLANDVHLSALQQHLRSAQDSEETLASSES